MQVSHWGRVYIEERYVLRNGGTAVTDTFNRWNLTSDFMTGGFATSPHIRMIPFSLPRSAQYIYTKDDLGATANMALDEAPDARTQRMTVIPRYPLLGGWRAELLLGYSVPLPAAVMRRGTRHTAVFLVPPLLDAVRAFASSPLFVPPVLAAARAARPSAAPPPLLGAVRALAGL